MIGDSALEKLDDHIEKFGTYLLNKMRLSKEERESLIDSILLCVERLPFKSFIYAGVCRVIA